MIRYKGLIAKWKAFWDIPECSLFQISGYSSNKNRSINGVFRHEGLRNTGVLLCIDQKHLLLGWYKKMTHIWPTTLTVSALFT